MNTEKAKKLGISPISLDTDKHQKLEKIQAFLHLTTGKSHTKPMACEFLIRKGIEAVEKEMGKYIQN